MKKHSTKRDPLDPYGAVPFWDKVVIVAVYSGCVAAACGFAAIGAVTNFIHYGSPWHGISAETYRRK